MFLLASTTGVKAQNKFDVNLQLQSMHYWRGLRVSDGMLTATSIGYYSKNLSIYGWGGLSFNGDYKEVTGVVTYSYNHLGVQLSDIFNFSGTDSIKYFDYKRDETLHLVDLSLLYHFSFMNISWSTIVYGNDCIPGTSKQRYSTYVEFGVPLKINDSSVTPFIAPAFVLNSDAKTMLYGDNDKIGIANVGIKVSKTLLVNQYSFPVSAVLGFNPSLNQASIQLLIDLF